MTAKTSARRIYALAFDNFAIGFDEAAKIGKVDAKEAKRLVAKMERAGIVAVTNVNGEELVIQVMKTYDDHTKDEAMAEFKDADIDFDARSSYQGTPRNDTAAHQSGGYRVVHTNKNGKVTARGERTRFGKKTDANKEAKSRNAAQGPRETGTWVVRPVERNAR